MRYALPIAVSCVIAWGSVVRAQEVVPLPPPDPLPPGVQAPPPPQVNILQNLVQQPTSPPGPGAPGQPGQPIQPILPPSAGAGVPPPGYYGAPPPGYYGPPPPGYYGQLPPGVVPPPGYDGPPPPVMYRRRPIAYTGDPASNPNLWMTFDALVWWSKNQPLSVPVVTTGPGSQGSTAGALGAPGTTSLNQPLRYGGTGGIWVTVGGWFDQDHRFGLEGELFSLGQQSTGFSVYDRSGNGNFVINEPVSGAPFSTQVSAPGVETGGVNVHTTSELWGGGFNGLFNVFRRDGLTVSLMGGFRYLELEEHLNIVANSALFTQTTYTDNMGNTLASAPAGSTVTVVDQFGVRNEFYGGQIGVRFQYMMGRWSFSGTETLAIGATHESVTINGATNVYPVNSAPVYLSGGNYATSQIGHYAVNRFAVNPGVMMNLGYQFTPFIRGTIGYNFLYLSNVMRPGNQIDNTYDGAIHPVVPMKSTSYWSQGLRLGLQVSF